ncbi:CHC2 zinc finger family protein [Streptococcus gallolyticus]|uniref:CHC2 zinc finger family protein n=1 Tax=Streptococcus gallolyticus TaxID=315405 RepID=A0A060RJ35_9STRE|nr:CHC2 zinc finger family protein [Streptococcus gallolyticus]
MEHDNDNDTAVEEELVVDSKPEEMKQKPISYEDYKQQTEAFKESIKQKLSSGELSINVDDDVYAYMVFNGFGNSHPLKTLTAERLIALRSSDVIEQLRTITDENVDAYKIKGTPEQERLYQSLKEHQKDFGLAEVSSRLVGEMAISAYNANSRLTSLSQEDYRSNNLSLFAFSIHRVIEYPYIENVGNGDYIVNDIDYALYSHLDNLSGDIMLTKKDLDDVIEMASYHTPKIIEEDNKKSLEETQEVVSSDSEQQKNERTSQYKGSLQPEAEGSTSPVPETGTFDRSVTSRPTRSSQYLNFTIKKGFKSRRTHLEQSVDKEKLAKLNRFSDTIQEAAQYYQNELANSKISYFTADGNIVQVNFLEKNFMHLTGLKFIGKNQTPEKTLSDLAMGGDISFDDIRISNTDSAFAKIKVLPELKAVLQTDSFYFDQLQNITRYTDRFDSLIKSNDKDIMVLFKATDENGIVPTSIFKSRETLEKELEAANKNDIIGIYRERDGQIEQIAINDEYIKDNGEEMLSILQNKQYQELSNEQIEMPEPSQPEVTAEDFTHVLDAVYNNGAQIGKDNRDNIPESLHPAWDKYDEYAAQHDNDFNQIMVAAEKDHLLDKDSDFYKAWTQDDIYDNHYHVRLQDLSDETLLPFQATDFIDYQTFARELYRQNQRSQSGDEVMNTTVNFAIYAPGGDLIKEGVSYHIGQESKPISQLLGLGYRRLTGYQDLAQMDEAALSQLENQVLNQTIAEDVAEGVPTSRETRQEVTASHNEAKTITSEREVLKNRFQRRVEEILNESPVQNQVNHRTGDIIINNSTVASNNSTIINSGIMSNRQTNTSTIHKTPSSPKKPSEPVDYQNVSAYELSRAAFQKIRDYTQSPKDLAEYLDFMSKFPTLSPRNVALIQAQWPGANAVATYNQWQAMGNSLGISEDDVMQTKATYVNKRTGKKKEVVHHNLSVKAGETSRIRLFRPQMEKMIPVLDSNGNQLKNEKGNPKFKRLSQATPQEKALVKEKKLKVTLFQKRDSSGQPLYTTYKVFELSQTTLKPESYPKAMPNRHYSFDTDQVKTNEVLEGLCDYAKSIGVSILSDDAHALGNIKGAFDPNRQEILLNPHNTPGEKIGTTIHELAHATLHNSKLQSSSQEIPRYQAELEAEMTSYLVSKHFGLDTGDKAFRYMAKWTDNLNVFSDKALADSMKRIHKTVMSMVKQVEHHTNPYQRNYRQQPNFPKAPDKGPKR